MVYPTATAAESFKEALYQAARTLFSDDEDTFVVYGAPGADAQKYLDWVVFLDTTSEQDTATLAGPGARTREETLTQVVMFVAFRKGDGVDLEREVSQRAYDMLRTLDRHCRVTDTTLGGTVEWCFLTNHQSSGETDPDILIDGRQIQIEATFTALSRTRG